MSSTNDTYRHLFVQTEPKSILKKSLSPRFPDTSIDLLSDYNSNIFIPLSSDEVKDNGINQSEISDNHTCGSLDNESVEDDTLTPSSVETLLTNSIMTSNENLYQYEIDPRLRRTIPCADSSSPSRSSDDEQQKRIKIKSKKNYSRPLMATGIASSSASSSDNNNQNKAKRSVVGSKMPVVPSDQHRQNDMQLDEFMRTYQQHGGIHVSTQENHVKEQTTTEELPNNDGNNYRQSPITHQQTSRLSKDSLSDDTISLLKSIDTIALSSKSLPPLQLLFDIARTHRFDRRTKIDRIRQYVEEQIGISALLTIYKLIKSSQIPIHIQQKPFCNYANFIPHLCCLIILESEEQKYRL